MSQAEQDKPKYGQYQQPEYGAMSGQYGPNYNPYIYGAPEPDTKKDSAAAAGDNGGARLFELRVLLHEATPCAPSTIRSPSTP